MSVLDKSNLTMLGEWIAIVSRLQKEESDLTDDLLIYAEKGDTSKVQHAAGRIHEIRVVLSLPDSLFTTDKD